jgi:hypothetical protein
MPDAALISEQHMLLIDRYLAGELHGRELAVFESLAANNPAITKALEGQKVVQSVLSHAFVAPAPVIPAQPGAPAAPGLPAATAGLRIGPVVGMVGGLAAAALIAAAYLSSSGGHTPKASPIASLYSAVTSKNFMPRIKQADPLEIDIALSTKLGKDISLHAVSSIRLLGLESSAYGSPLAISVYALAGDEHIMLVLDRSRPSEPDAPVNSSRVTDQPAPAGVIYRHEANIHGIRLIELSTRPSPTLLETIIVK